MMDINGTTGNFDTYSMVSDVIDSSSDVISDETHYPIYIACAVGVVGVIANGFVLLVLCKYSNIKWRPSSILVIHQTTTDTLCSILILLTNGMFITMNGKLTEDIFGTILCRLIVNETLFWISFGASSFSLVSITLERYMIVVHPIFHRNHFGNKFVAALIIADWALAVFSLFPMLMVSVVNDGWCIHPWPSKALKLSYGYTYFFGTFLIPVILLVYGYGKMIQVLTNKNKAVHSETSKSHKISKSQINTTRTMIIVAVVFIICLMPYQVYYLVYITALGYTNISVKIYFAFLNISLLNCCINPFIYAVKFDAFKTGIRRMLGLRMAGVSTIATETSVSRTVTKETHIG